MAPAPVVTGISPKEAKPGTKIIIRGENLGSSFHDLLGVFILGKFHLTLISYWLWLIIRKPTFISDAECILACDWKSSNKIEALCPPREGVGQIIIVTRSGGVGTCNVQVWLFQ